METVEHYRSHCGVSGLTPEVDWFFAVVAENDVGVSERCVSKKPVRFDKPIGKILTCILTLCSTRINIHEPVVLMEKHLADIFDKGNRLVA